MTRVSTVITDTRSRRRSIQISTSRHERIDVKLRCVCERERERKRGADFTSGVWYRGWCRVQRRDTPSGLPMTPRYRWKMLPSQAHIEHQQPNSFPTTCHESKISRKLHNLSSTWILGPLSGPRCASARPDTNQFDKAPRQITCFACDSFFISLVSLSQATTLSCSAILTRDFFAAEELLNAVFFF